MSTNQRGPLVGERLRRGLLVTISGVWVVNVFAGYLGFQSDPMINGIFTGTVGLLLVAGARNTPTPPPEGD